MSKADEETQRHEAKETAKLCAVLKSHTVQIAEHFDTVQVIATKHTPEGTQLIVWGEGNHYARLGSVEEWLSTQKGR